MSEPVGGAGVRALFERGARSYDRVNSVISLGLDRRWRGWVAREAVRGVAGARVLDAFAGTGLVGLAAASLGARVTLADESPAMLAVAARRAEARRLEVAVETVDLTRAALDVKGAPFDAVTISFGVRYLRDPAEVLRRLAGTLVPGGRLVLLDFCVPSPGLVSGLAAAYFFHVLPVVAGWLAGDRRLYQTLVATTRALGGPDRLPGLARQAGLEVERVRVMGFGLVVGVVAVTPHDRVTA